MFPNGRRVRARTDVEGVLGVQEVDARGGVGVRAGEAAAGAVGAPRPGGDAGDAATGRQPADPTATPAGADRPAPHGGVTVSGQRRLVTLPASFSSVPPSRSRVICAISVCVSCQRVCVSVLCA